MSLSPATRDIQRSDATAPLLEAVRQRQSAVASGLIAHWVHRHGLGGLERFRSHVLIPELGLEAAAWLDALLALDPAAACRSPERPGAVVRQPGSAWVPPAPEAVAACLPVVDGSAADGESAPGSTLSSSEVARISPLPQSTASAQAVLDLHARAEAAVDAAFAALETSFPDAGGSLAVVVVDPAQAAAPDPSVPLADPGWWSLLSASTQSEQSQSERADPEPSDAAVMETRDSGPAEQRPEGLQDDQEQTSAASPDDVPVAASDGETAPHATFSALWRRLDRQRSKGMQQLSGVLRECLEETLAPLRTPQEPAVDAAWELPFAPLGSGFVPPAELQVPLAGNAPPEVSEPGFGQIAVRGHGLPAAPAADPLPETRTPPSLMDRLTGGRPLGESRRGDSGRNRPAPAPAALSDLRAWLPDASDLPRAS